MVLRILDKVPYRLGLDSIVIYFTYISLLKDSHVLSRIDIDYKQFLIAQTLLKTLV